MNKILLIDRIDPSNLSNRKNKVFFIIGGMNVPIIENKLIDTINESDFIDPNDMVLKYNGIELNISVREIPKVVKLLTDENFSIYGVYQIYNPDE